MRRLGWLVICIPGALIGGAFAGAALAGLAGGELAEGVALVGGLVALLGFVLIIPACVVALVLDRAAGAADRGKPIAASWDVVVDGTLHIVSLPAFGYGPPDHAWVDGESVPLVWSDDASLTRRARLVGDEVAGTLHLRADTGSVGVALVSAALTGVAGSVAYRCTLDVDGGVTTEVRVVDGRRAA